MEARRTAGHDAHRQGVVEQKGLYAVGAAANGDIIAVQGQPRDDIGVLACFEFGREDDREAEHRGESTGVADKVKMQFGRDGQGGRSNGLLRSLVGGRTEDGPVNSPDDESDENDAEKYFHGNYQAVQGWTS